MVLWMIEKENESLLYPRTDSTYPSCSMCLPGLCHSLFLDSHSTHFLSAKFFPLSFFLLLSSSFFSPPFFRSKSFASDASLLLSLFLLLLLLCMLINCAPFSQHDWLPTLPSVWPHDERGWLHLTCRLETTFPIANDPNCIFRGSCYAIYRNQICGIFMKYIM